MAGQNQFLAFATGQGANTLDATSYAGLPAVISGFQSGVASSQQANSVWRQATTIAAALGQFIANSGYDALDNGDVSGLATKLVNAVRASAGQGRSGSVTANYTPISNGVVIRTLTCTPGVPGVVLAVGALNTSIAQPISMLNQVTISIKSGSVTLSSVNNADHTPYPMTNIIMASVAPPNVAQIDHTVTMDNTTSNLGAITQNLGYIFVPAS